jgi:ribosome modulation factor
MRHHRISAINRARREGYAYGLANPWRSRCPYSQERLAVAYLDGLHRGHDESRATWAVDAVKGARTAEGARVLAQCLEPFLGKLARLFGGTMADGIASGIQKGST